MGVEVFTKDDHDISWEKQTFVCLECISSRRRLGDFWIPCDLHLAHISSKNFVDVVVT